MKKIKIEIECDDLYVADALHELAEEIENGDYEDYAKIGNISGSHYNAIVKQS